MKTVYYIEIHNLPSSQRNKNFRETRILIKIKNEVKNLPTSLF